SFVVNDCVKTGIIVIEIPVARVTGIITNLCPYKLIAAKAASEISPWPIDAIALLNVNVSTFWYKGIAILTKINGPAYENNSIIKSFIGISSLTICASTLLIV